VSFIGGNLRLCCGSYSLELHSLCIDLLEAFSRRFSGFQALLEASERTGISPSRRFKHSHTIFKQVRTKTLPLFFSE
jgi:hypothetical protein